MKDLMKFTANDDSKSIVVWWPNKKIKMHEFRDQVQEILGRPFNFGEPFSGEKPAYVVTMKGLTAYKPNKSLRKWRGRAWGRFLRGRFYIAAYSKKQAAELIGRAADIRGAFLNEINNYYAEDWDKDMSGIEPVAPCVYYRKDYSKPYKQIL
jgi:hypothetical protein